MNLSVTEKLKLILSRTGMTMGDLARATGQSRQNLSNKFTRGNFSEREIQTAAEALGCSVEIVFTLPDGSQI